MTGASLCFYSNFSSCLLQAYHDHLQGQKHKKKVAKAKPEPVKGKTPVSGNLPVFVCELCDIECTAADAYAAHLRGAKHTKVSGFQLY